ncbi:DUF4352 domain-containing protein [Streptomyces sp. I6]|uniref:DUF4352 domain-containing protein n=1 Tax=Streptomyces sp. I6 TaxID=2483113 RepID=UPI000F451695|nr:DUF4352 domain-containing protein [Streptomyces sp. I6]RNL73879.1 DUF4352 domain-containing protein [Streptomyces sp. I6]
MKKTGPALLAVLTVLALPACGPTVAPDGGSAKATSSASAPNGPASEQPTEGDTPVELMAEKTDFTPTVLHDGSDYTSVLVTVSNNGDKEISVNPLRFSLTDTTGTKHTATLAVDKNQIDTVTLAPGENASGTITGKGTSLLGTSRTPTASSATRSAPRLADRNRPDRRRGIGDMLVQPRGRPRSAEVGRREAKPRRRRRRGKAAWPSTGVEVLGRPLAVLRIPRTRPSRPAGGRASTPQESTPQKHSGVRSSPRAAPVRRAGQVPRPGSPRSARRDRDRGTRARRPGAPISQGSRRLPRHPP